MQCRCHYSCKGASLDLKQFGCVCECIMYISSWEKTVNILTKSMEMRKLVCRGHCIEMVRDSNTTIALENDLFNLLLIRPRTYILHTLEITMLYHFICSYAIP